MRPEYLKKPDREDSLSLSSLRIASDDENANSMSLLESLYSLRSGELMMGNLLLDLNADFENIEESLR